MKPAFITARRLIFKNPPLPLAAWWDFSSVIMLSFSGLGSGGSISTASPSTCVCPLLRSEKRSVSECLVHTKNSISRSESYQPSGRSASGIPVLAPAGADMVSQAGQTWPTTCVHCLFLFPVVLYQQCSVMACGTLLLR